MSQENVEIVRRAFERFQATRAFGDPEFHSPDHVYRPMAGFTESEEYRGIEGYRGFGESFLEAWADDFTINATSLGDYGDAVIARLEFRGHARASGIEISERMFEVLWLRDGLIIRTEDFADRAQALKAVGLEE